MFSTCRKLPWTEVEFHASGTCTVSRWWYFNTLSGYSTKIFFNSTRVGVQSSYLSFCTTTLKIVYSVVIYFDILGDFSPNIYIMIYYDINLLLTSFGTWMGNRKWYWCSIFTHLSVVLMIFFKSNVSTACSMNVNASYKHFWVNIYL